MLTKFCISLVNMSFITESLSQELGRVEGSFFFSYKTITD